MLYHLRGLSSKRRKAFSRRHNNDSTELKVKTAAGNFGLLMPQDQHAKKRVTVLAGLIDLNYQGETGLLLHMEVRKRILGI
jgi:dUTPase